MVCCNHDSAFRVKMEALVRNLGKLFATISIDNAGMIGYQDVVQAAQRLQGRLLRTPCVASQTLSDITGAQVYLKFENLQFTSSFKERGAYFVAPNGTRVLKRSIPKSMIQKMPDGGYVAKQNIVVVSGDILPAVKAFVEMLENARDRRES